MWYHSGVRTMVVCLLVASGVTACGTSADVTPSTPAETDTAVVAVNPAAVTRARSGLPPGYEVADLAEHAAPATFWGFKPGWAATPEQCGALVDPGAGAPVRGWSASGPGGIIYAVVAGPGATEASPDGCATWSLAGGHSGATVTEVPTPASSGSPTVAMSAVTTTTVESGTQTRLHADTVTAYLRGTYIASVTVVTDPGSVQQPLPPDIAPSLLAQVVSAVAG